VHRKSFWLKVKDWIELKMPASRFLNVCVGLGLLVVACGAAIRLAALSFLRCCISPLDSPLLYVNRNLPYEPAKWCRSQRRIFSLLAPVYWPWHLNAVRRAAGLRHPLVVALDFLHPPLRHQHHSMIPKFPMNGVMLSQRWSEKANGTADARSVQEQI